MAFDMYCGATGGVPSLMNKLQKIYSFKKVVCEDETPTESSLYQLWVSDEVFLRYAANSGWCDLRTNDIIKPVISWQGGGTDERSWKIIKSPLGVVFGVDNNLNVIISATATTDSVNSVGLIGLNDSTAYLFFDGRTNEVSISSSYATHPSVTQLVQIVVPNYNVYFPNAFKVLYTDTDKYGLCKIDSFDFYANKYYMFKF